MSKVVVNNTTRTVTVTSTGKRGPAGPGATFAFAIGIQDAPLDHEDLPPFVFADSIVFPDDFTGSQGHAATVATADAEFTIAKNGAPVGTITFEAGSQAAVFSSTEAVSFTAGDVLTITCPTPRDATLSGIAITLRGSSTSTTN